MHVRRTSNLFSATFRANRKEEAQMREKTLELLKIVGLDEFRDELATSLPYGKQRRLEIARALATQPSLLLLDEPAAGMGGQGVVSVLSNVLPRETVQLCDRFFAGDIAGAAAMQRKYVPLIRALFSEVNPIPVKAAMAAMGFCENYVRLPLTAMEKPHEENLLAVMRGLGIL